jgi:uncharacterized protein YijF (DUF1287 family)
MSNSTITTIPLREEKLKKLIQNYPYPYDVVINYLRSHKKMEQKKIKQFVNRVKQSYPNNHKIKRFTTKYKKQTLPFLDNVGSI